MPAPVAPADRRSSSLLTVLFWIGVAFAPVAALILLFADGNGLLRFGAVLAVLAAVLIGLSIALRGDGGGGAAAEELRDELEQLRRELRAEIVAAAQRGNQALDQAQRAQDGTAALRARMDAVAVAVAGAVGPVTPEAPGTGRARVSAPDADETVGRNHRTSPDGAEHRSTQGSADHWTQDGTTQGSAGHRTQDGAARRASHDASNHDAAGHGRRAQDDADGGRGQQSARTDGRAGWGRAAVARDDEPEGSGRATAAAPESDHSAVGYGAAYVAGGYGSEQSGGTYGGRPGATTASARVPEPEQPGRPSVYRHTETVHVTRHTVVDGGDPGSGRYGEGWSVPANGDRPWAGYGPAQPADRSRDDRGWVAPEAGRDDRGRGDDDGWRGYAGDRGHAARPDTDRGREAPDELRGREAPAASSRAWAEPAQNSGWAVPDPTWEARRDPRGRYPEGGRDTAGVDAAARGSAGRPPERAWTPSAPEDDRAGDPADGAYWSAMSSGDIWAEVREDERGRELRVGERRAEVHADGGGYRVRDRWASVRREHDESARGYDRPESDDRPALPVGGVPVPQEWRTPAQWTGPERQWDTTGPERPGQWGATGPERPGQWGAAEPEPETHGRRQRADEERYGYPPRDDVPRAGGARAADRWR
ncbi:hypothetical protein [Micromonospora siamensis]|uniref:Uncharacterized protein n=1 Tax=Micromonospora siamensis TaxID=299152 RepID=A0A1C5GP15_9ACTN|nr:hypothetical protein [Micromonospora siamensis]SCG35536.1 hypothetical protein GA0074704_0236 [Micromonospora siamensis]